MKVLELFAGSRSIGKQAEKLGMDVFSTDINDFPDIDYVVNILNFDFSKVPFHPDIIWASPPCTTFSVASIGHHWQGGNKAYIPKTDEARKGLLIAHKTLDIIRYFEPNFFFIENPRGVLRKMDFMQHMMRHTVTYSQYGDTRMKPTDIWTNNMNWNPLPSCRNGDPCHEAAPRGSKTGTQGLTDAYHRSKIPDRLCKEILMSCL